MHHSLNSSKQLTFQLPTELSILYVTPGSLSVTDGTSWFQILAVAHWKNQSQKHVDVHCTTNVRISEDLIWWRPVILTSWQWQSQPGKSPWTAFYVRTASLYSMHCLTSSQCSCMVRGTSYWYQACCGKFGWLVVTVVGHQWRRTATNYNSPTCTWRMALWLTLCWLAQYAIINPVSIVTPRSHSVDYIDLWW